MCYPNFLSQKRADAVELYNRQGAAAMQRGAYREASFYLLSAIVCDPGYWPAFFNLGNTWVKLGEDDAAIWAYEQAVGRCDDYAPLFLNLGILYCRNGQCAEAIPYLEQAWRLSPGKYPYAIALGYAYFRLTEYDRSWFWYRKALDLNPTDKRVRESLILIGKKRLASGN